MALVRSRRSAKCEDSASKWHKLAKKAGCIDVEIFPDIRSQWVHSETVPGIASSWRGYWWSTRPEQTCWKLAARMCCVRAHSRTKCCEYTVLSIWCRANTERPVNFDVVSIGLSYSQHPVFCRNRLVRTKRTAHWDNKFSVLHHIEYFSIFVAFAASINLWLAVF